MKSSKRACKNPGHNVTRDNLKKLLTEAKSLAKEFSTEMRPAYAIHIADAGGVQWMVPEEWFFRYLVAFEKLEEIMVAERPYTPEIYREWLDSIVEMRLRENCSERYR